MLFMPFRVDLELVRTPFVTILICIACLVIFQLQISNNIEISEETYIFCQGEDARIFQMALKKIDLSGLHYSGGTPCELLMRELLSSNDVEETITMVTANAKPFGGLSRADSQAYAADLIRERFRTYQWRVPDDLTSKLEYDPKSWNPLTMITSVFTHGSWGHVIGNLFFFFAFAATVEIIVGSLVFFGLVIGIALLTGVFYSVSTLAAVNVLSTVGLSGVVMGMMALFAYFLPQGRIRCFLWFVVIFRTVAVPAWLIVIVFVGIDVHELLSAEQMGTINLVAHVSGAAVGFLAGVLFFGERQKKVREMYAAAH